MKKFTLALLFIIGTQNFLNAQTTTIHGDTITCYEFFSPTDSIPYSRVIHHYNVNNNIVLYELYMWDTNNNLWHGENKHTAVYDLNNNYLQYISYNWDENTNNWVYYEKSVRSYDTNNKLILDIKYDWDENLNDWVTHRKYEYSYDMNGNEIVMSEY